ncbi:unnamed protein product [Mesocestoides corti]|uniref:EF-hand domain-containing family member C2 n=1 Tax=Mesocestoides corti TaxID=53468 RepID=A0A0R3U2Y8_MESCO|nr:unnamed protein product [Mesocestoides corti]
MSHTALPFLPGNVFDRKIGKEKFHKSHYLEKKFDLGYLFHDNKPGIGGDRLPGQRIEPQTSIYPTGCNSQVPAWIAFDKQVLCFDAYFQQAIHERRDEQYRVRRCQILFYLEDDTMQVVEPRIQNSALSQGTIVRRHRIRKPPPYHECFYTVHDFNVGIDLPIYGRVYRVVSCDQFTAAFLRKMGVRLNEPEPIPEDPYTNYRIAVADSMQPRRPLERLDKLRQFLDHDRHVLRFFCFWDDTDNPFGDARDFVLCYFLADDTIEIREVIPANSGRDAVPCFLRRQKLPKGVQPLPLPGTVSDRTILNTSNASKGDHYTDQDLTLGSVLNVYGRKFLICDCDEFTKEYYKTKYGITTFTPVAPPKPDCGHPPQKEDPPYNGWGTDEDSLTNCRSLLPVPPPTDFAKFMEKDACGLESHVLRFAARILTDEPYDKDRCFIVSCFLRDDTFMVYEPPVKNSGFKGGKFMERRKVMKPGQPIFRTKLPIYYAPVDLFVGAQVVFNNFVFEICGADEYAYAYMEAHPAEFPYADLQSILKKLRPLVKGREEEIKRLTAKADPHATGSVEFARFEQLIRNILKDPRMDPVCIVAHEVATLARHYAVKVPKETNYMAVIGVAQQQLRKAAFEEFQELLDACRYEDIEQSGSIEQSTLRRICRANRVPLPDDLLLTLMEISQNFDNGLVYYESFINQLNWRCNPVAPGTVPCDYTGNLEVEWSSYIKGGSSVSPTKGSCQHALTSLNLERVRYGAMIADLNDTSICT